MAFPYIFESNFEGGTFGEWDTETDTASQIDVVHYSDLARFPWNGATPYRGAYCMRAELSGGTADATVTEGDIDMALAANNFFRFAVWFSPDFTATSNDTVHLLELQSAGPTIEVVCGFRVVASTGAINIGIGETAPTSFSAEALERGVWYTVELDVTLDDGGSNDGTIDVYVTKAGDPAATSVAASQVGSLDQAAIIQGVFGIQNHLATTTGTILLDDFAQDDARLFPSDRYAFNRAATKSTHVFIGRGHVDRVQLLGTANGDEVAALWDTDEANTNHPENMVVQVSAGEQEALQGDFFFNHGCYVQLTGTNPRAQVYMPRFTERPGLRGPTRHDDATVRSYGLKRKRGTTT